MSEATSQPLAGYRVVDLTVDRGELCGRLLADLGAEVIKVEIPGGSPARRLEPTHDGVSLFFACRNAGKKSVVLDPNEDSERLQELLAHSDVLITSHEVGQGPDHQRLLAANPHLVITAITAYGFSGAWSGRVATDTVLAATSSTAAKAGLPDREPLSPPASFVDDCTSIAFAFGTVCALFQRDADGHGAGQILECSVNETMANQGDWTLSNNAARLYAGAVPNEGRTGAGVVWPSFRCKDGFVRVVILAARQWRAMRAWLGEPDYLQDPALDGMMERIGLASVIEPLIEELFADMTMDDISAEAQGRGIVCTPLAQPADVLNNEHFAARKTLVDVDLGGGLIGPVPSGLMEVNGERAGPAVGPPAVGAHTDEIFANLGDPRPAPAGEPPAALPLAGLRVADFGHGGVGPEVGRMLAEYGAEVIKIESRTYPDFIRTQLGTEMSPSFAASARSKKGMGVNAKEPRGVEVLKKLVAHSDIVVENNSTGTMDTMGLGWSTLHEINPGMVMLSSQLMGSSGPWKLFRGYGPSTRAAGGLEMLWNYNDLDAPAGGMSIFPDHVCGRVGALGAVAGLLAARNNGGVGSLVELAQVEVTVAVAGDLLCKEKLEPGSVSADGNRSRRGAPWGLFPCAAATDDRFQAHDQWVAITVRNDADWAALVALMGSPDWAKDPTLADASGRHANVDAVEAGVAEWTAQQSREDVATKCQAAGIPAGEMVTALETTTLPHFVDRGFPVAIEQPGANPATVMLDGPGIRGSRMTEPFIGPAPLVGEHTRELCTDLLGMTSEETEELIAAVVLEVTPAVPPPG